MCLQLHQDVVREIQDLEEKLKLVSYICLCTTFRDWIAEQDAFVRKALEDSTDQDEASRGLIEYETQVKVGEKQMRVVAERAKELVNKNHKDVAVIEKSYQEAAVEWNKLIAFRKHKDKKIDDITKADTFDVQCDEMNLWIQDMDKKMNSKDVGGSLPATRALVAEHDVRLKEIDFMKDNVSILVYCVDDHSIHPYDN